MSYRIDVERCVYCVLWRGYKYNEIAVALKMNENTVKVQLHRGMERLRQAFSTYDYIVLLGILGRLFVER